MGQNHVNTFEKHISASRMFSHPKFSENVSPVLSNCAFSAYRRETKRLQRDNSAFRALLITKQHTASSNFSSNLDHPDKKLSVSFKLYSSEGVVVTTNLQKIRRSYL